MSIYCVFCVNLYEHFYTKIAKIGILGSKEYIYFLYTYCQIILLNTSSGEFSIKLSFLKQQSLKISN